MNDAGTHRIRRPALRCDREIPGLDALVCWAFGTWSNQVHSYSCRHHSLRSWMWVRVCWRRLTCVRRRVKRMQGSWDSRCPKVARTGQRGDILIEIDSVGDVAHAGVLMIKDSTRHDRGIEPVTREHFSGLPIQRLLCWTSGGQQRDPEYPGSHRTSRRMPRPSIILEPYSSLRIHWA